MKRKNSFVLDEKDDKAVQLFTDLAMPKNLAKTLMFISQVDECKSADVEQGADLRQPEVSVAMQELRRRGWAKKRDLKKKGKGRPACDCHISGQPGEAKIRDKEGGDYERRNQSE